MGHALLTLNHGASSAPANQVREYYVLGDFDDCQVYWSALKQCLGNKVQKDPKAYEVCVCVSKAYTYAATFAHHISLALKACMCLIKKPARKPHYSPFREPDHPHTRFSVYCLTAEN